MIWTFGPGHGWGNLPPFSQTHNHEHKRFLSNGKATTILNWNSQVYIAYTFLPILIQLKSSRNLIQHQSARTWTSVSVTGHVFLRHRNISLEPRLPSIQRYQQRCSTRYSYSYSSTTRVQIWSTRTRTRTHTQSTRTRARTRSRGTCILRYLGAGHLFAAVLSLGRIVAVIDS